MPLFSNLREVSTVQKYEINTDERLDEVNDKLSLIQKKKGMTFGTDALLLSAFIDPCSYGWGVEFGAGSGIASLLCAARNKFAHITAIEVQPEYADLCKRNVALNGFADKIEVLCQDVRTLSFPKEANAVFSNPPYFPIKIGDSCADDGRHVARHEVCGDIYDFCKSASKVLKFGGYFYVVYHPSRLSDLLLALNAADLAPKRMTFVCDTAASAPSMVLIKAKKGAKNELLCTPALYLHDENGNDSPEMAHILAGGGFPEFPKRKESQK